MDDKLQGSGDNGDNVQNWHVVEKSNTISLTTNSSKDEITILNINENNEKIIVKDDHFRTCCDDVSRKCSGCVLNANIGPHVQPQMYSNHESHVKGFVMLICLSFSVLIL